MKDIITLTLNPSLDKSAHIDKIKNDTKLRSHSVTMDPGGGGINVSRAIKKLGGQSTALYFSGGFEGKKLHNLLLEEDINQHQISINASIRENVTILEDATGNQYRFGMPGPEIDTNEIEKVWESLEKILTQNSIIVASGSLPESVPNDFYRRLVKRSSDAGAMIIVDASGPAMKEALEANTLFLIKPNIRELAQLTGSEKMELPEIQKAAMKIINDGKSQNVVVSLGAGGACLVNSELSLKYDSPTVAIDSRIGAGDSMIAGIVLSIAEGKSIRDAVQNGVAAGAAAVITPGTELCRLEDVKRLYGQINITEL